MKIMKCPNGHFYDSDRQQQCPYCASQPMAFDAGVVQSAPFQQQSAPMEQSPMMPSAVMGAKHPEASGVQDETPYVFISYAHADSEEVTGVISYLQANHFNVWYDEGIKSGFEWADEISRKIKHCKQFICFISQNSVQSESVKDEIHIAWKYNINTIVVYLEKIELDGGLEMKLDRKQAILRYAMAEQDFRKKLGASITQDAVTLAKNRASDALMLHEKYEILRTISCGGTATTYLAKHKVTGVQVLLKHAVYDHTVSGRRIKKSFEKEKAALAKNCSPFIPALYDYFCEEKNIYLAESYIEGTSLIELKNLSLHEKLEKCIQAAKVIRELHHNGIYHCDIKPEHIIVNRHGCFLIDFGSAEDRSNGISDDVKMGTVAYAAPEQFASYNGENDMFGNYGETVPSEAGRSIDERTDIYAFGRVMVKIISNNCMEDISSAPIVEDQTPTTTLFASATNTICEFSENPLLQAIIEKMVREKKSNRYRTMDEVIRVLEDFLKIYPR